MLLVRAHTLLCRFAAEDVITHVLPSFNGLYRSFTSTPHSFTLKSFLLISTAVSAFLAPSNIERLNTLLLASPRAASGLPSPEQKRRQNANALLGRYRSNGRPLSGNFLVCAGTEIQWTMLSQVLIPGSALKNPILDTADGEDGAEASNLAWDILLAGKVAQEAVRCAETDLSGIKKTAERTLRVFEEMLGTIGNLKGEAGASDLYIFEVMSESLVRLLLFLFNLLTSKSGVIN